MSAMTARLRAILPRWPSQSHCSSACAPAAFFLPFVRPAAASGCQTSPQRLTCTLSVRAHACLSRRVQMLCSHDPRCRADCPSQMKLWKVREVEPEPELCSSAALSLASAYRCTLRAAACLLPCRRVCPHLPNIQGNALQDVRHEKRLNAVTRAHKLPHLRLAQGL